MKNFYLILSLIAVYSFANATEVAGKKPKRIYKNIFKTEQLEKIKTDLSDAKTYELYLLGSRKKKSNPLYAEFITDMISDNSSLGNMNRVESGGDVKIVFGNYYSLVQEGKQAKQYNVVSAFYVRLVNKDGETFYEKNYDPIREVVAEDNVQFGDLANRSYDRLKKEIETLLELTTLSEKKFEFSLAYYTNATSEKMLEVNAKTEELVQKCNNGNLTNADLEQAIEYWKSIMGQQLDKKYKPKKSDRDMYLNISSAYGFMGDEKNADDNQGKSSTLLGGFGSLFSFSKQQGDEESMASEYFNFFEKKKELKEFLANVSFHVKDINPSELRYEVLDVMAEFDEEGYENYQGKAYIFRQTDAEKLAIQHRRGMFSNLDFSDMKGVRIDVKHATKDKMKSLPGRKLKRMVDSQGNNYKIAKFSDPTAVSLATTTLVKEEFNNGKVAIFQEVLSDGSRYGISLQDGDIQKIPLFFPRKRLSAIFASCPTLVSKYETKELGSHFEDLKKAADLYKNCN